MLLLSLFGARSRRHLLLLLLLLVLMLLLLLLTLLLRVLLIMLLVLLMMRRCELCEDKDNGPLCILCRGVCCTATATAVAASSTRSIRSICSTCAILSTRAIRAIRKAFFYKPSNFGFNCNMGSCFVFLSLVVKRVVLSTLHDKVFGSRAACQLRQCFFDQRSHFPAFIFAAGDEEDVGSFWKLPQRFNPILHSMVGWVPEANHASKSWREAY